MICKKMITQTVISMLMIFMFMLIFLCGNEHFLYYNSESSSGLPVNGDSVHPPDILVDQLDSDGDVKTVDRILYESNYKSVTIDCSINNKYKCLNSDECRSLCLPTTNGVYCDHKLHHCIASESLKPNVESTRSCLEDHGKIKMLVRNPLYVLDDEWKCLNFTATAKSADVDFSTFICEGGYRSIFYTGYVNCTCPTMKLDSGKANRFSVIHSVKFGLDKQMTLCVINDDLYEIR